MKNIEQELKLQLDKREYDILAGVSGKEPQLQTNFYFVYDGMPRDMMVRLRSKNGHCTLCYKRRLSETEGVNVCDERECPLSDEHATYVLQRGVSVDEMRKLLDVAVPVPLRLAGKLDTYRTAFTLREWHLELDKNVYLGVTDFELECESGDVAQLQKLQNYLYYTYGVLAKPSRPKSERFFEALK